MVALCAPAFGVVANSLRRDLRTPALFVHGTKDPFGSIEELREAIALIPARTDVLPVEGAAHDLKRAAGLAADLLSRLYAIS